MEVADIGNITQSDQGVAWLLLSYINKNDNRYAYSVLNGSTKENGKPKTIETEAKFDIDSYNQDTDEFFIEYKLYVDDTTMLLDGFSLLKQPKIIINFYNGESYEVVQDEYCNDNLRDDYLTRHVKIDRELSLDMLNNPFKANFVFDNIDSVADADVIIYCDYIKFKIVSSLPSDDWDTHLIPYFIRPNGGFTHDAGIYEKEYGAYGEFIDTFGIPIDYSYRIDYESKNLRDDEYTIIKLDDGITFDSNHAIESQNCSLDYDSNTNIIKIYSASKTEGSLKFWIKLTKLHQQDLTVTTNYQDFTRVLKFNPKPPLVNCNYFYLYEESIYAAVKSEEYNEYKGKYFYGIHVEIDSNAIIYQNSEFVLSFPSDMTIEDATVNIDGKIIENTLNYNNMLVQGTGITANEKVIYFVNDKESFSKIVVNCTVCSDTDDIYERRINFYPCTKSTTSSHRYNPLRGHGEDEGKTWIHYNFNIVPISFEINNIYTKIQPIPETIYAKNNYPIDVFVSAGASELPLVAHSSNYFKLDKPTNSIQIAKDIAYIGAVRLNRGHKADVTANTGNAPSSESYQNRKYLGKTGNWEEDIGMTLRIPWKDVVTLQNHAYHDAPIPINTCPDLPDGDPLNHRGWAEIYRVKNIKKINNMLYQCEPEVEYLTHELLGKFNITLLNKICPVDIGYLLTSTHEYTDDLREILDLASYKDFYNLEIDDGMYKGVYTVEDDCTYTFKTREPISTISQWSYRWRNILQTIDSQAHDNNHWQMAFRILDHKTNALLLEYLYYNFIHVNDNDELLNECDVKVTTINDKGEYDVTNYSHMNLDFDEVTASSYNNKANTTLKVQQTIEAFERGHNVGFTLIDWNGTPLSNRFIDVNIFDDDGNELQSYTILTTSEGHGNFEFNQNKGVYRIQYKFIGDNDYNECFAESELYMNIIQDTQVYFDIANNQTFTEAGNYFEGYLRAGTNQVMNDEQVYIYIRKGTKGSWKSTPYIKTTDVTGKFRLQINLSTEGVWQLKCVYKGHDDYTGCEEIVNIKRSITTGTTTKLITNDLTVPYSDLKDNGYTFDAILKTNDDKPISGQTIIFTVYFPQSMSTKEYTRQTDSKGLVSLPIRLNAGIYYIDTSYDGVTKKYKPITNSNKIIVKARELINTKLVMRDLFINDCHHHELGATLTDENDEPLMNYPVRFEITQPSGSVIKYTHLTNKDGMAELNINLQAKGTYKCKAVFEAHDKYNSTSTKSTMKINRPTNLGNVNLSVNNASEYGVNQPIYITAKNDNNQPIPNLPMSVYFYDGDTNDIKHQKKLEITMVRTTDTGEFETNSNGQIGFIPLIASGIYTMRVVSYCNNLYNPSEKVFTVTIGESEKQSTEIKQMWINGNQIEDYNTYPYAKSPMSVKLLDSDDQIPLANKTIEYHWGTGGKIYYKTTNENGIAKLNINHRTATVPVRIVFKGDKAYSSSEISFNANINPNNVPSGIIVQTKEQVSMDLLDYDTVEGVKTQEVESFPHYTNVKLYKGANPLKNKQVTFTVYGENNEENTYYRTTNNEGIATLEFLRHTNNVYPVMVHLESDTQYAEDIGYNLVVNLEESSSNNNPTQLIDRSEIAEGLTILETPDPETYNGTEYGSTIDFDFNNNVLNIHDYGLVQDSTLLSGKIAMSNIILPEGINYDMEVAVSYDAMDNFVQEMIGTMQVRVHETKSTLEYKNIYSNLFSSPALLHEYSCKFTRDGEDGKTYYYDGSTSNITKQYSLSPFLQYKGGVNLETENGIDLFKINKAFSPIILQNGFVKIAFHHRSGYIYIYRYNYSVNDIDNNYVDASEWVLVRILKITNYATFRLLDYSQDKATIQFGESKFSMWRGRPFIQVEHENQDLLFTRQVDRVFCEVNKNEMNLEGIGDNLVDRNLGEFKTFTGLNIFTYDLHIGQDIRTDNYIALNSTLSTPYEKDRERALKATINGVFEESGTVFPKNGFERPSDVFSLLINRFKTNASVIHIVLYGVDGDSLVEVDRQDISESILHGGELNQVRVSFDVSDNEYKYFKVGVIIRYSSANNYIMLNELMLYQGDSEIPYEKDDYMYRLDNTEIYFENNFYANFYNAKDDYGLCVVRPYFDDLKLSKIPASKLTALIPYMRDATFYDTPEMVAIEYLYFKEEKTELQGGDYGI